MIVFVPNMQQVAGNDLRIKIMLRDQYHNLCKLVPDFSDFDLHIHDDRNRTTSKLVSTDNLQPGILHFLANLNITLSGVYTVTVGLALDGVASWTSENFEVHAAEAVGIKLDWGVGARGLVAGRSLPSAVVKLIDVFGNIAEHAQPVRITVELVSTSQLVCSSTYRYSPPIQVGLLVTHSAQHTL